MIRRNLITVLVLMVLVIVCNASYAEAISVDLSSLTFSHLKGLMDDVDKEIELHHTPDSNVVDDVLSAMKEFTESYYAEQGIEISWAWYDYEYEYTRAWDCYRAETHIDYKDKSNTHQQRKVGAVLFPVNDKYTVYYLVIGEDTIVDRRDEILDKMWISTPIGIVNKSTGLDLSTVDIDELDKLKQNIEDEISKNHTPVTKVSDWLLYLVKLEVEQHFWQQEIEVSWAWTEYEYTRDWDHYSLTTHIDYTDAYGSKQKPTVYAEAYPRGGRYVLFYLTVGDQTLVDIRNQLPTNLIGSIKGEEVINVPTSAPTPIPTLKPTPKPALVPTPKPSPKSTPTPKPTPVLTPTPKPTLAPTSMPTSTLEQYITPTETTENELGKMVKIIHTSSVNVRRQSNTDSEKVGTAMSEGVYQYLDTADNGWLKIRLENGIEGWVSGKMAIVVGTQAASSQLTPIEESSKPSKEEIDLAASKIIIEIVINRVNNILESNAITSYSIQNTGYVYFNMSYDFIRMSKDERQVMLDGINNALYSQIAGAGVPYSSYRYFVGDTVIAENKRFLDPYSVKLK